MDEARLLLDELETMLKLLDDVTANSLELLLTELDAKLTLLLDKELASITLDAMALLDSGMLD